MAMQLARGISILTSWPYGSSDVDRASASIVSSSSRIVPAANFCPADYGDFAPKEPIIGPAPAAVLDLGRSFIPPAARKARIQGRPARQSPVTHVTFYGRPSHS